MNAERGEFATISRKLRKSVGHCELCGSVENLEVHHKVALRNGGSNDEDNLLVLCKSCHRSKFKDEHASAQKLGISEQEDKEILVSLTDIAYLLFLEHHNGNEVFLAQDLMLLIMLNLPILRRTRAKYTNRDLQELYKKGTRYQDIRRPYRGYFDPNDLSTIFPDNTSWWNTWE